MGVENKERKYHASSHEISYAKLSNEIARKNTFMIMFGYACVGKDLCLGINL